MELKVEITGLEEVAAALKGMSIELRTKAAEAAVKAAAVVIAGEAAKRAPVGTGPGAGKLRRSIRPRFVNTYGDAVTFTVIADVPYSAYVEFGTKPHIIRPRTAKMLHWTTKTVAYSSTKEGSRAKMVKNDIFARVVHHPGTKAQPFMGPALSEGGPRAIAAMVASLASFIARMKGAKQ